MKKTRKLYKEQRNPLHEEITLNEWFDIWCREYKYNRVKVTTIQTYQTLYDCQIREKLGEYRIRDIRPFDLQILCNQMIDNKSSSSYIHNIYSMLSNIFKFAVNNELMGKNPCDGIILPSKHSYKRTFLTLEEQKNLLQFVKQEQWQKHLPIITTLLGTGMRIGELLALTWDDIDFKTNTISINKTMVYIKNPQTGHFEFQTVEPKTQNAYRAIPMVQSVKNQLKMQKNILQCHQSKNTWNPLKSFVNLVFPNKYGKPQQRGDVQRILNRIVRAYNEEHEKDSSSQVCKLPNLHPHMLRHSFATRCFELDIPPKTVQMLLGHSSIQLTMDIYTHVSEQKKREDMKKLEDTFAL